MRTILGYAGVAILSVVILVPLLHLRGTDLRIPLCSSGDSLYYQSLVQGILDQGWYLSNPRLGVPGGQDYREFPVSDGWAHLVIIKALGLVSHDSGLVMNLFYCLTFPLTALTALFFFRRLGLSYGIAASMSLLYSFLYYHLFRFGHLFLIAYYLVPLAVLVLIRISQGRLPLVREPGDSADRQAFRRRSLGALAIAFLVGMGGVYYALFTCFFAVLAGARRTASTRRWAALLSSLLFAGVVFGSLLITLAPSILYKRAHPGSADAPQRLAFEAEMFGLKVVQLLLPAPEHRVAAFRQLTAMYNGRSPLVNENLTATLGLIGSFGFLMLLGRSLLRSRSTPDNPADGLALFNLAGVLLATVGGLGATIAWAGFAWIRCYNRISVFLALFALAAVGLSLQAIEARWGKTRGRRLLLTGLLGVLLVLGLLDQNPSGLLIGMRGNRADYKSDSEFVARLEEEVGKGQSIFQLPYHSFPEGPRRGGEIICYDLLRIHVHSRTLKSSFGALIGHDGDLWNRFVTRLPTEKMVHAVAAAGFAGIYIDRLGYDDRAKKLENELAGLLGVEPLVSRNERLSFFDVRPFAQRWRNQYTPADWAEVEEKAGHPVTLKFLTGFSQEGVHPNGDWERWSEGKGVLRLRNTGTHSRHVKLSMELSIPGRPAATMRIDGDSYHGEMLLDAGEKRLDLTLTAPPGSTDLKFHCRVPMLDVPTDARRLGFLASRYEVHDVDPQPVQTTARKH